MKDDELELWRGFRAGDQQALEELRKYYKGLVGFWVKKVAMTAPRAERDDLMQAGLIKLEELIHKFDPDEGNEFIGYAGLRIRGALYESLRKSDNLRDYPYKNFRRIKKAQDELMRSSGTRPTVDEIARKVDLTPKQVNRALDAMSIAFTEEFIASDIDLPPSVVTVENPDDKILIGELLLKLNERERLILTEYYYEGRTDLEISERHGLTKDNVKRIRRGATKKLFNLLGGNPGGEDHED